MPRFSWAATALLAIIGCLPLRPDEGKIADKIASGIPSQPIPRTHAPVTPAQVNKDNARNMSTALWEEMDRAEVADVAEVNDPLAKTSSPAPKKK